MGSKQTENAPYSDSEIEARINHCPSLGSLRSINQTLNELIHAEQSYTAQIAEIIRRDPSLTTRLLKVVNSVFFGLNTHITNIEEAVFYLGLRQIRELGMATPVIEEINDLGVGFRIVNWRQLWQHSIGTAILTRECMSIVGLDFDDDTDYITGLVHNVGKIVIAFAFPSEFDQLMQTNVQTTDDVCMHERKLIGWDHARIGAYYLKDHSLSEMVVEGTCYHNEPQNAPNHPKIAATVQLADHLVRSAGINGIENTAPVKAEDWANLPGWPILFPEENEESQIGMASIRHSLTLLPTIIRGMV